MAAGGSHTLAIRKDGTLWTWGYNDDGQLGYGTTANMRIVPVQVGTATTWKSAAVGPRHTMALRTDGTLWAWGYNGNSELGDGTGVDRRAPVQVGTATNWANAATGLYHTVAVRTDGTLWAWGNNSSEQLGEPSLSTDPLLIEGGDGSLPLSLPAFSARTGGLRAAPVPLGSGAVLTLDFTLATPLVSAPLTLTDITGRVLLRRLISAPAGPAKLVVPELTSWPAGLYIVRLVIDGRPAQVKVVRE
ncbi:hypothetical protein LRS06_21445 [Hymenobacter sp. J193]|uniref:RCC1 domain-containing protein n=1 Tax=Hymenobacter sp. J193 TaxID=2898429 RepID=UPI0021515130|nr:hypothetical protein [Hymenobacter sp. J193]MCR5890294.1 hypothetical protein [Hymenobacter sp. J193]